MYRPLYDRDEHRFNVLQENRVLAEKLQKGLREHLLCTNCEGKISLWEKYASEKWYARRDELNFTHSYLDMNLDYKKMKLFFLSVLWRMSICSSPFFKNIKLGSHETNIHHLLIHDDPSFEECYAMAAFWYQKDNILDNAIGIPGQQKLNDRMFVILPVPNFIFYFDVSEIVGREVGGILSCREEGVFRIADATGSHIYNSVIDNIIETFKRDQRRKRKPNK